jgi:hypothetical protein
MSEDDSLINKLEALMSKHRGTSGMNPNHDEDDIPVLTEMLDDGAPRPAFVTPAEHDIASPPAAPVAPVFYGLSDERIRNIARDIRDQAMNNIEPQLAGPIMDKLLQEIDAFVQTSVRKAVAEMKQEIADSITAAVTEALAHENDLHDTLPDNPKRTQ